VHRQLTRPAVFHNAWSASAIMDAIDRHIQAGQPDGQDDGGALGALASVGHRHANDAQPDGAYCLMAVR
jgi:hypothetical protein